MSGSVQQPLNLTISPAVEVGENLTVQPGEVTRAVVQKVRDILAAAEVDDTVADIMHELRQEEVKVRVITTEAPKTGEELFRNQALKSIVDTKHNLLPQCIR